jgi:hypothetical protein
VRGRDRRERVGQRDPAGLVQADEVGGGQLREHPGDSGVETAREEL